MKGKKFLPILLPIFIIVWGYIFFKIFKALGSSPVKSKELTVISPITNKEFALDTFSLNLNYEDPFTKVKIQKKKKSKSISIKKTPTTHSEVSITYKGLITSIKSKTKTGFFTIGQQNLNFCEKEGSDEFKVISLHKDYAVIKLSTGKTIKLIR